MTELPAVYVIQSFSFQPYCFSNYLKELLPDVEIIDVPVITDDQYGHVSEDMKAVVRENAEIIFGSCYYLRDFIYSSKRLKWVQSSSRGVDRIFTDRNKDESYPDVIFTKTGSKVTAIGEYVIGQIIAWERSFYKAYENKKLKTWDRSLFRSARSLSSLRIGIIGAGSIGAEIGSRCKRNGMEVWTLSKYPRKTTPFDKHLTTERLPILLENCDFICGALPSTPETRGLLSGDVLKHCQTKKPVLINVGRGDLITSKHILKALRNDWISGAILDVFDREPLIRDSELWDLPNVIITPHVAFSHTHKPYVEHFVSNYKNYIRGKTLMDEVDWEKGY